VKRTQGAPTRALRWDRRRWTLLATGLLAAAFLLAGCATILGAGTTIRAAFTPSVLTVTDAGGEELLEVAFTTPAGGTGGFLSGYAVTYLDARGVPLEATGAAFDVAGVNLRLPPGSTCEPFTVCPPSSYRPQTSEAMSLPAVPSSVTGAYLASSDTRGIARFAWTATLDTGQVLTWTSELTVLIDRDPALVPTITVSGLDAGTQVAPDHAFDVLVASPNATELASLVLTLGTEAVTVPAAATTTVVLNETFEVVSPGDATFQVAVTDAMGRSATSSVAFTVALPE